ncbi:uncharacterized protein LOC108678409 [Hyalella azteca]|uniref:Uncharacterized protein LOC108678409 n=1 Tax=Hyalella azteca TaxID=294128 RepID=A0A8B7P927_HYAAZ|nr:uncharacterized protein LOC108678409 [Hyalella azteca]
MLYNKSEGVVMLLVVALFLLMSRVRHVSGQDRKVGVAEPNLDALRGLDLASIAGLQEALAGGGGGSGVDVSSILAGSRSDRDLARAICGSGGSGGSSDSLTNLLVYQYLMGSLPERGAPADSSSHGRSTSSAAALQALLGDRIEGPLVSTRTTVSTSLTTTTVLIEPTTRFLTSSSTYTTTVTNIDTKVIPVIFRGSKVTTTFTESTTEVIVATEFMTSSTVDSPTILQTLPVHITLTATSTRGLDGHFTLADLVPGASSVVQQPIATSTVDLDASGVLPSNLDLNNIDLSQYDLSSLTSVFGGSDQKQMVNALAALLEQYGNEPPKQISAKITSSVRQRNGSGTGRKQDSKRIPDFNHDLFVDPDEPPKFNVIKGFTLSDRAPANSGPPRGSGGGSAATATRYSKYHKKPDPENNGVASQSGNADRESERYSASESTGRKVDPRPQRRPNTEKESTAFDRFRSTSVRNSRGIESQNNFGSEVGDSDVKLGSQKTNNEEEIRKAANRIGTLKRFTSRGRPNTSLEKVVAAQPDKNLQTTVLTMFVSGTAPGDFKKTERTITLRSFQPSSRVKRDVSQTTTALPEHNPQNVGNHVDVSSPLAEGYKSAEKLAPEEIVKFLKTLDKDAVEDMMRSLKKWVHYYSSQLIQSESSNNDRNSKIPLNEAPLLSSSLTLDPEAWHSGTAALSAARSTLSTEAPSCPSPVTVTKIVYHTVTLTP